MTAHANTLSTTPAASHARTRARLGATVADGASTRRDAAHGNIHTRQPLAHQPGDGHE